MAAVTADADLFTSRGIAQDPSAPDAVRPHGGDTVGPGPDDLDDLFNYDRQIGDVFRDIGQNNATGAANAATVDLTGSRDLGIDEEVKVRKPRAPVAKLDEERLLGTKGIPKLRKIGKERFKFKGKGHEYSDVAKLLTTYQLWLDDLFPKAKFADGLTIIEKLGHTKRMQVMRKAWIDEDKPKPQDLDEDADFVDLPEEGSRDEEATEKHPERALHDMDRQQRERESSHLDDLYAEPTPARDLPDQSATTPRAGLATTQGEQPEPDELDELLAEDAVRAEVPINDETEHRRLDNYDDDEEAMAAMNEAW
ncbi:MAG: chromosome segregation in meiosis- protein [Chrysothrix sp. TS-e1954]|nr:MAG: chromosome segregation in meiosis- protein [Chrysothrix sp. TS-e1954]